MSYPTVESLLARHGTDAAGRAAARAEITERITEQARRSAALAGRPWNCKNGWHTRPDGAGCRNSGATCICTCHDPQEDQ